MSNALVPVTPISHPAADVRTVQCLHADFAAQLIATAQQAPQTRARRRAEPEEAVEIYRARGRRPTMIGHTLSRSL